MTLVACAVMAAQQQTFPDTRIDFTLRGTRLERAIPILEKKLKLKLFVDPVLDEKVIAMRVTDMPVSSLMAAIARATVATWTWKTDQFVLERTPELALKLKNDDREKQLANVLTWQKEFSAKLGETFWTDKQTDAFVQAVENTNRPKNPMGMSLDGPRLNGPIAGLVRWLAGHSSLGALPGLGPRQSLELTSRYETGPSAFNTKCRNQIALVPKVYDKFLQVAESQLSESDRKQSLYQDVLDFGTKARGALEYQLKFTDNLTYFSVSGAVLDSEGRQLTWSFLPYDQCPSRVGGAPIPDFMKSASVGEVPLSETSAWFESLTSRDIGSSNVAPSPAVAKGFKAEDKARWAEVLSHDPLSFTATDLAFALAGKRDVVACLPDMVLAAAHRSAANGKLNLASFWAQQKSKAPIAFVEGKEALVIKPTLTTLAETLWTDRHALEDILKSINKNGYVRLADWARYSDVTKSFLNYRWAEYVLMSPYVTSGHETPHPIATFENLSSEFLGTLGTIVLAQLDQGRGFSTMRFDDRQKTLLHQLCSWHWPEGEGVSKANLPARVEISVSPCEVGIIHLDLQDGGRLVRQVDLSTERGRGELAAEVSGAKSSKFFSKSRRFRIVVSWTHAPDVTIDVVEFGPNEPFKSK